MNTGDFYGLAQERLLSSMSGLCQKLDWDGCRLLGNWLGLVAFAGLGRRRQVGLDNIQLALGVNSAQANQILRRSCVNFGMTFTEFLHMPAASPEDVRRVVSARGLEHIFGGLESGRGVILQTAHLGNWELMGAFAAQNFPMSVVARPMNNARTQPFFDAPRAAHNFKVLDKAEDTRAILKVLKQNKTLAILPDQYAGHAGEIVPMFGHPTSVWSSVSRLAMVSGALVVPSFGVRQKPFLSNGRIVAQMAPAWKVEKSGDRDANVQAGIRRMVWEMERIIRAHPEQWLWLHRRWRDADKREFNHRVAGEA